MIFRKIDPVIRKILPHDFMTKLSYRIFYWVYFSFYFVVHSYGQNGNSKIGNSSNSKIQKSILTAKSLGSVTAGFTAPDNVCTNSPVQITNTSTGASNYY